MLRTASALDKQRLSSGVLLATLALWVFGCSTQEAVDSCSSPGDCSPNMWCISQMCVLNSPPVAVITTPTDVVSANQVVTLDATASYDPDAPNDSVVLYSWSFAPVAAGCSPPWPTSSGTPQTQVVFTCPGTYEVSLLVRDELSASSPQVHLVIEVAP